MSETELERLRRELAWARDELVLRMDQAEAARREVAAEIRAFKRMREERDLARAELASARQELDAVRTARDRLDADMGAVRAGRFVDPAGPLAAVANERKMQDDKWGVRDHPDGTISLLRHYAAMAKRDCERAAQQRRLTWSHILAEEFWEAMTEDEPAKLRAELVQVAAVAVAWVEAIDRRSNLLDPPS